MFAVNDQVVSDETISDLVVSLPQIGEGSCRQVFDLGDVVLKVNRAHRRQLHGSCETEAAAWEHFVGTEHEHLFAPVLASGDGWLIMAKADSISTADEHDYHEVKNAANRLGITDLFHANLGIFAGQCKVIDYATGHIGNAYYSSDECPMSSELCECGSHTCSDCYSNGCGCCCDLHLGEDECCAEYEGCETVECDDCYQTATCHVPEVGEWFGFKFGVIVPPRHMGGAAGLVVAPGILHYCAAHTPVTATSTVPAQIPGQRGFLIWDGEMLLPWEPAT